MFRRGNAALAVCLLVGLGGCVTETSPAARSPVRRPPAPSGDRPAQLPEGPIATPAGGRTETFRASVAIRPRGVVPYDGMVLPLISPDGRFLATQFGLAPTWATLLAQPASEPPSGLRIGVYDLAGPSLSELAAGEPIPEGVMIGRSCDTTGYLVEWPRPDGSRWIGKASWTTSRIAWIAQGAEVNAHGVLLPNGAVAYTRRSASSPVTELVVRSPGGGVAALSEPNAAFALPVALNTPDLLAAFLINPQGIELLVLRLDPVMPKFGGVVIRRQISRVPDVALAFQCVAMLQTPPPPQEPGDVDTFLFLSPNVSRMVELQIPSGRTSLFPERSVAAVRAPAFAGAGYLVTTPEGLVFSADPDGGAAGDVTARPPAARLFDTPHIPRVTRSPDRPAMLIGPVPGPTPRIQVIELLPTPTQPAPRG